MPLFYKHTPTRSLQKPKKLNPSLSSNFIYKKGIAFKSLNTIIYRVKRVGKWEILISTLFSTIGTFHIFHIVCKHCHHHTTSIYNVQQSHKVINEKHIIVKYNSC